ncbi:MAG: hypothetical protein FJ295_16330 [Planctomycetes bacterium]|nr:hypothetical protein [Planctomycetota bacterium]
MDRWAGPLRAWLRGRCASPDDVVQETFCRLVQQAVVPERVSAWLFRVASNLAKDEARRGQRVAVPEAPVRLRGIHGRRRRRRDADQHQRDRTGDHRQQQCDAGPSHVFRRGRQLRSRLRLPAAAGCKVGRHGD